MVAFPHSYAKLDYDPPDYVRLPICGLPARFGINSAAAVGTLADAARWLLAGTHNFTSAALPLHFFPAIPFARTAGP